MAKNKKSNKSRGGSVKFNFADERWPKIIGVLSLLFALYLAVAFVSYFYTWKIDQDKVLQFSWEVVFQSDLSVANWLGRLGAFISNAFFYWGFGLPSIVVIFLLIKLGIALVRRKSLRPFLHSAKYALIFMSFFSLALEFFLRGSEFTWGGAFGESTCYWLTNFMGQIGLFLLLLFTTLFFIVWKFNPNLDPVFAQFSIPGIGKVNTDFFRGGLFDLNSRPGRSADRKTDDEENSDENQEKDITTLRPSHRERAIPKPDDGDQDPGVELEVPDSSSSSNAKQSTGDINLEMEIQAPPKREIKPEVKFTTLSAAEIAEEHAKNSGPRIHATEQQKNFNEPYDPTLDLSRFGKGKARK